MHIAHKTLQQLLGIACLVMFATSAQALRPIGNLEEQPITEKLSMEKIKKGIRKAGLKKGWQIKEVSPGHLEGVVFVRSHVAKVDITYDTQQYSITYKDSTNLKHREGMIHKNYNNWVILLNREIQLMLNFTDF